MAKSKAKMWERLSDRQKETALLIMKGRLTRAQMAKKMKITLKTFDSHRRDLLAAMQMDNAVQLALFGVKMGLVKP